MMKGQGSTVFISGEAGSGKTRVSTEFLNLAKQKGILVLAGWCLSNIPIPYFPFLEAFQSISSVNEEHTSSIQLENWLTKSISSENIENVLSISPKTWKDQTFAAITKELLFLSTKKPTILFLDDLHWADSASLSLVHYISRAIGTERIMILGTFRNEEIFIKTNETRPHPLAETLRLMGREDIFEEMQLKRLDKEAIGKIARSMLGSEVSSDLIDKLIVESGGNPLFAIEFLRMHFEQGSLVKVEEHWRLTDEKAGLPTKIIDVINRRIDYLDDFQRKTLEAASVLGEKFYPKYVTSIVEYPNLDVLKALNQMEQSTHLIHREGKYYKFDHAKIREWIYNSIPDLIKEEYHQRCALTLEKSQTENKIPAAEIASHYILANNKEKSVSFSLLAGKHALARFSNNEAINHFNYVLKNLRNDENHQKDVETALAGLGDSYYANNLFKEAIETYEQLSSMQSGNEKVNTLVKAMHPTFFHADIPHLIELVKQAEENQNISHLEKAKVIQFKGSVYALQCQFPQALKFHEEALAIYEEEYALPNAAWLMFVIADIGSSQGFLERAVTLALQSIALHNDLGDYQAQMEAYNEAGATFHNIGLTDQALAMYEKVVELDTKTKMNNYFMLAKANLFIAQVVELFDVQKSINKNLEALKYCIKSDSYMFIGMIYANLARLYTKIEDREHADEYFDKLVKLPPPILMGMYSRIMLDISKAVYYAGKNDWEKSIQFRDQYFQFIGQNFFDSKLAMFGKTNNAWILAKQGKTQESEIEQKDFQNRIKQIQQKFEPTNIQTSLMSKRIVNVNEDFEIRIDLINIGKSPGKLLRVESTIPPNLTVIKTSSGLTIKDGEIELGNKTINGFEDQHLKIIVKATNEGSISLDPRILYLNSIGQRKVCKPKQIQITIQPQITNPSKITFETELKPFEFSTIQARKTFEFLTKSFVRDYLQEKFPIEKCGWCTFMEIAKKTKLSRANFYAKQKTYGPAITELKRQGLVDIRVFTGERGRGGKILKTRVNIEKDPLKRYVMKIISKNA